MIPLIELLISIVVVLYLRGWLTRQWHRREQRRALKLQRQRSKRRHHDLTDADFRCYQREYRRVYAYNRNWGSRKGYLAQPDPADYRHDR
ncbi:MAG: hypothetical protein ABI835_20350 [Chloroflexota bacterium]